MTIDTHLGESVTIQSSKSSKCPRFSQSIYRLDATTTLQCPLDIGQVQSIFHVANAECHMDMIITSETGFENESSLFLRFKLPSDKTLVAWNTRILTGHRSRRSLLLVPRPTMIAQRDAERDASANTTT